MIPALAACLILPGIASPPMPQQNPNTNGSELRGMIEEFRADQGSVSRFYTIDPSPTRRAEMRKLFQAWRDKLQKTKFDTLTFDGKVDYLLFRNHLDRRLKTLEIEDGDQKEIAHLIPFASEVIALEESRRRMEPLDPQQAAEQLLAITKEIAATKKQVEAGTLKGQKHEGNQAAQATRQLKEALKNWSTYYTGYDPMFTWWAAEPYKATDKALGEYADLLREKIVGVKADDENAIIGNPLGREALLAELQYEMVPFTPEQLVEVAEKEYAWCEREAKKAAKEMGFGDDWRKAQEHVKTLYVPPGQQTRIVRELALEAIDFVEKRDLVTVPELAKSTWRMEMMSPERQLVSPFFLGGEQILVSYPTNTMTHEQKLMSMRANNTHFSRATVQHELIPGHHLQGFMQARYKPYRSLFSTPFWTEGWALYWEMLLWDLDFPRGPEDRIGMLFWRMHRCARIVFSLNFHLGKMTPQECIDYLVEKVGHERASAEGEVRRSFSGAYPPLYQAAYMVGGLQIRALERELVESKKMTYKEFHDAILKENNIPIEMVRVILTKTPLTRDYSPKSGELGLSK
ncbi:MAG: DUF885 family protein [Fimbriimonas sp.]